MAYLNLPKCLEVEFCELRFETVRKGVRVMLRADIWPVYWGQNGPNGTVWVPCGPAFRVPPGLFRQFLDGVLGSSSKNLTHYLVHLTHAPSSVLGVCYNPYVPRGRHVRVAGPLLALLLDEG
jgi:hypothetical protein